MRKTIYPMFIAALVILLALGVTGCSKKAKVARYLERADKYFADGNYDAAEIEYVNALRLDRTQLRSIEQLGFIAFEEGRSSRAFQILAHSSQMDPNNTDVRSKLALLYLAAGKFNEAHDMALYVLDRRPQDPDAPLVLADSATRPLEIESARQRLRSLNVSPAERAPAEVGLGNLDLRMQDPTSAHAAFEGAIKTDPKFAPAYGMLGNLYWLEGKTNEAEQAFKMCSDLSPLRSPRRIKYASFKAQTGDYAAGRQLLEEVVQKAPDYVPALLGLAEIDSVEKKYDDAVKLTESALARDPENYEAYLLTGRLLMFQGNPSAAVADFEKMVKTFPKNPQASYQLALAYSADGDTAKAISTLNDVIAQTPGFSEAILSLAQLRISKGDFNPAIISLQQLLQQHPDMSQALLLLGDAYRQKGDLDDALKTYRQLEEAYPRNAQTPLLIGRILEVQRRIDDARSEFNKSLALAPDSFAALEQLVDLDVAEGKATNALQRVQKRMEQSPNEEGLRLLLARVYLAQDQTNQAEAAIMKAIESRPDYPDAYLMLNELYLRANDNAKALDALDKLLAHDPKNADAWLRKGLIQMLSKDYAASRDSYEKVLSIHPQSIGALNNLACLYSDELNDLDKADAMARRVRDLSSGDPATADTLGWICYKRGDFAQALKLEEESAIQLASNPEVALHLGLAYYAMGMEDKARSSLQYADQSKMVFPSKEEAARCLAVLAVDVKTAGADERAELEKRISQQPGDPVALSRLAALYKRDGNMDKAIETYESALKANPKNAHALMDLAQIYLNRPGEADRAFALAKTAYTAAPDDANAGRVLGRAAFLTGDYKWSLSLLQEAAQKWPDDPELVYDLAQAAYSEGRVADSQAGARSALQIAGFSRVAAAKNFLDMTALFADPARAVEAASRVEQNLKTEPNDVPALMAMGAIDEQKGDATGAIQTYEKALAHYPEFSPAQRRLAILYVRTQGDVNKAAAVAAQARLAYPDDPEVAKALGIVTYRQGGDYEKAAKLLQEAAVKTGTDPELLYFLGMAEYQLKQRTDSKGHLSRALELKLPDAQAQEAKRVLAELK